MREEPVGVERRPVIVAAFRVGKDLMVHLAYLLQERRDFGVGRVVQRWLLSSSPPRFARSLGVPVVARRAPERPTRAEEIRRLDIEVVSAALRAAGLISSVLTRGEIACECRLDCRSGFSSSCPVSGSTIYVTDAGGVAVCTTSGCPSRLTDTSIRQITGAAVDSHGNVWAAYYTTNIGIALIVWPSGKMPGKSVSGFVNSTTPGALLFDKQDRLVSIVTHFSFLFTYACDAKSAACTNTGEMLLQGASDFGALNRRNDEIQVTDEGNHCVDVYAYPSFQYEYSYNRGLVPGYAVVGIVQTR